VEQSRWNVRANHGQTLLTACLPIAAVSTVLEVPCGLLSTLMLAFGSVNVAHQAVGPERTVALLQRGIHGSRLTSQQLIYAAQRSRNPDHSAEAYTVSPIPNWLISSKATRREPCVEARALSPFCPVSVEALREWTTVY
jgi:hypothetical protein